MTSTPPLNVSEALEQHQFAAVQDAPAEEEPITLYARDATISDFQDYGLTHLSIGDAQALINDLQRSINEVREYLDNPVYTECANWRCGNEVRDGGDYCAFCTDAGKGTPAWGPIR